MQRLKRWCLTAMLGLTLAGCTQHPPHRQHDTPECMNYRAMMTAPMPPDAMKRLQARCEASRRPW
ncbi:hypothetical protein B0W47_10270 [Komagataeibacter nataicola]|uniref:Lipoprotein n=1 Tax=Komagataeibacter nataicola TaxID=265960 RepID=A0A9N7CHT4_9PROT|nr:hypothetical protein B0W47_10270 [Komagataeibacter nataicola]PYD66195.1 hypothetical protein CDI09_09320 [Komagataeibacter nataicola]